jgi:hypothetical protein
MINASEVGQAALPSKRQPRANKRILFASIFGMK